jgi:hypothetical protein
LLSKLFPPRLPRFAPPEIKTMQVMPFDQETIDWMFDRQGRRTHLIRGKTVTREELLKMYPVKEDNGAV